MIRFAHIEDTEEIRQLWGVCFDDSDEFAAFYFQRIFRPEQTLIFKKSRTLIASMQIIPYTLQLTDKKVQAGYVYGAMTHPDHRRQGSMQRLMKASFKEMSRQGMEASFLIPQAKRLFNYYSAQGYEPAFPKTLERIRVDVNAPCSLKTMLLPDQLEIDSMYGLLLSEMPQVVLKTSQQTSLLLDEFRLSGGQVFVCPGGIALASPSRRGVLVKELLAATADARASLLVGIARHYRDPDLSLFGYSKTNQSVYYGMLRPIDRRLRWSPDIYMSMMFD